MRFLSHCLLLIVLAGCSLQPLQKQPPLYWPALPATPRVVYETTLRNSDSIRIPDAESRLQKIAVNNGVDPHEWLVKPYDVAARDGLIIVSDTLLSVVHVFDIRHKRLFAIGWRGKGKLIKPLGVALDNKLNIYVADAGLKTVVKYDSRGHFLRTIGNPGDFSRIADVAVSPVNQWVYVLDRGGVDSQNHRFKIYSQHGKLIKTVGTRGAAPGDFNHPTQIATDKKGRVYVLDSGNFRVQIFTADGKLIRAWGKLGQSLGDFARPRGLAVSDEFYIFVSDSAFQNFQIFNESGQLLLNIGQGGGADLPGRYMLPAGIAVDETGRIYVVDQMRQKIDVFRLLKEKEINALLKK